MIELLYTTLILFGFFITAFFIFPEFKPMKIFLIFFQLILSIILLSDNFYRDQSLYEEQKFNYIQNIDFYPIKSINSSIDEKGKFNIILETMNSTDFSLIKTSKYSKECLKNYYIKSNDSCPITDIIIGDKRSSKYRNYIQVYENEYIFYSNETKLGKLYKSFNYSDYKQNIQNIFSLDKTIRREYNKLSNPMYDFKFNIKFIDVFIFALTLLSFYFAFFESLKYNVCDLAKVFNFSFQTIIFIINFIRFIKFIEVKKFLFDNEDLYNNNDEKYFPNKYFNIDSFPLSISINFFIFNFLHARFPDKLSCCEIPETFKKDFCDCDFKNCNDYAIYVFFIIPFYIIYFIFAIFDILNDNKIYKIYNQIIYNWNMHPIKSIRGYDSNDYFNLDSILLNIVKMDDYDYIKIYSNKNGKICGKDNFGNNLYFPKNEECPINKIYISKIDENIPGYNKIKINGDMNNDVKYLYFTNQFIEGKIIIDLNINLNLEIPINPNYPDDFTKIPFYDEIDNDNEKSYLYSVYYVGINKSLMVSDEILKIHNFDNKIKEYISLAKGKLSLFCMQNILMFLSIVIYIMKEIFKNFESLYSILIIIFICCFIIIYWIYFIFIAICLDIHIKYVTHFMNKINSDFEREKADYKWNFIILLFDVLFLILPIIIGIFKNNIIIAEKSNENKSSINESKDASKTNFEKKREEATITEREEVKSDFMEGIKKDNNVLKVNKIQIDFEKDKLKEEIKNKEEQINKLNETIKSKDIEIEQGKQLNVELEENHQQLEKSNEKFDREIQRYKSNIPFELNEGEELMCIILKSFSNATINYPFLCKKNQIFNNLENSFFEKYPQLRNSQNVYLCSSINMIINKNITLEQNHIKNGDLIMLKDNNNQ